MASSGSTALCLPDHMSLGPGEAFIDAHEFCHLHPLPEGDTHVILPPDLQEATVRLGWAEPHPAACLGAVPRTLVLLYAPRTRMELDVVFKLISSSYRFARGLRCWMAPDLWHCAITA